VEIELKVNGTVRGVRVRTDARLLDVLRDEFQLGSVRDGCSVGMCGACTILVDGRALSSCLTLAALCHGARIVTAEGLRNGNELDPIVESFAGHRAFQCSYCTPGFVVALKGLLLCDPAPTPEQVISVLGGHLCRCGSYSRIVTAATEAVENAARTGGAVAPAGSAPP
jgi:aerobic-type carbon monoxide dehydrogenase small subunit (CoxS/CutS family)